MNLLIRQLRLVDHGIRFEFDTYLGLYYESIDDKKKAAEHMEKAAKLGPLDHYMGDVARVHWNILKKDKDR
jgi:hypothetical protein